MGVIVQAGIGSASIKGSVVNPTVIAAKYAYPVVTGFNAPITGVAADVDMGAYNVLNVSSANASSVFLNRGSVAQPLVSVSSNDSRVSWSNSPDPAYGLPVLSAALAAQSGPVTFNATASMDAGSGLTGSIDTTVEYLGQVQFVRMLQAKAGTHLRTADDLVAARLSGSWSIGVARVFAPGSWQGYNPATWSAVVRNTSNPLYGQVDMGALCHLTTGAPCTLISPRHVIMAAHWQSSVGATIGFLSEAGTLQTRTVSVIGYPTGIPDCAIGYLSAAVSNVTPVSILAAPFGWCTRVQSGALRPDERLEQYQFGGRVFAVPARSPGANDGIRRVAWVNLSGADTVNGFQKLTFGQSKIPAPTFSSYASWPANQFIGGDSGSQIFTKLAGKTVLLTQLYTPGQGGLLAGKKSAIDACMNAIKGVDATAYAVDQV